MPGTDLEQQDGTAIELLGSPAFAERIAPLLPDTLPLPKFVQIAKTAIRNRPELAAPDIDQRSLFNSLIYLAQLGLLPDGKKAALNVYRTKVKGSDGTESWVKKVQALPMVEGVRDVGAEYGWNIRAEAVYANDEFDVVDEPPSLTHKRVRPGVARGDLVATYAIAVKDGTRYQVVLYAEDVAKRRAKAKTDNIWKEWPEAMWRKSAVHALFRVLPKSEAERMERLRRLADDIEPAEAAALLYGPDGRTAFAATELPTETSSTTGDGANGGGEHPADEEEEPTVFTDTTPDLAVAAAEVADTTIPAALTGTPGVNQGRTLAEVAEAGYEGEQWFGYAYRHPKKYDDAFNTVLRTFLQGAKPDLWAELTAEEAA